MFAPNAEGWGFKLPVRSS